MSSSNVFVLIEFTLLEEPCIHFNSLAEQIMALTRAEKGCVYYAIMQQIGEGKSSKDYMFVEKWETNEDLDNHIKADFVSSPDGPVAEYKTLIVGGQTKYRRVANFVDEGEKGRNSRVASSSVMPTHTGLRLAVVVSVSADMVSEFERLAKELVVASNAEEGCREYGYARFHDHTAVSAVAASSVASDTSAASSTVEFVFVELWSGEDSLAAHSQTEHYTTLLPQLAASCGLCVKAFLKAIQ